MPDLGKAYVQIVPSANGIAGSITKVISGESEEAGVVAGKSMIGSMVKVIGAAGGAAVAAKTLFDGVKSIVGEYANYEQLTGGIETLFKDSADIVMDYANNAYKTAGLSANDYMETVTNFSASLLQSLGGDTAKAAEKADRAITDMSDNANKMGTSMESIQNAYQGFAKANYTMLDNLKLGYGGTKEEMQRLLEDAEKISGIHYDISSYADIVDAIHVVQTELGITGTTAEEASSTITGSLNAAKAAWKNLLSGMGNDGADVGKLTREFASAAETAIQNIIPVAETALDSIGVLVDELSPIIADKMPEFIASVTPILTEALAQIALNLAAQSPAIFGSLAEGIGDAIDEGLGIEHVDYYIDEYGQLMPVITETANLVDGFAGSAGNSFEIVASGAKSAADGEKRVAEETKAAADAMSEEEQAAAEAHAALIDIASAAIEARYSGGDLREEYNKLSGQLDKLRDSGDKTAVELAEQKLAALNLAATNQELASGFPALVSRLGSFGVTLTQTSAWLAANGLSAEAWGGQVNAAIDDVINEFSELDTSLDMSLEEMASSMQSNIEAYSSWNENIATLMNAAKASGNEAAVAFVQYMTDMGIGAADQVALMASDIEGTFDTFSPMMGEAIDQGMLAVYNNIEGSNVGDAMQGNMDDVVSIVEKTDLSPAGRGLDSSLASGVSGGSYSVTSATTAVMSGAKISASSQANGFYYVGTAMDSGMVSGINANAYLVVNAATNVAKKAYQAAKKILDINSPSKVFRDEIGAAIPEGMALGIDLNADLVEKSIQNMLSMADSLNGYYKPDTSTVGITGNTITNNITVNGAEDPEVYANRLARQLKLQMRMA